MASGRMDNDKCKDDRKARGVERSVERAGASVGGFSNTNHTNRTNKTNNTV